MKTTIEIDDALLREAKRLGIERDLTLKAIVDLALRRYVDEAAEPARPFKLRRCSVKGQGLQPGLDENDFATIRAMAYRWPSE